MTRCIKDLGESLKELAESLNSDSPPDLVQMREVLLYVGDALIRHDDRLDTLESKYRQLLARRSG